MIRFFHQHFPVACLVAASFMLAVPPTAAHEKPANHQPSALSIEHVMKAQFDRPDAPLTVVPVTVEGNYAIAGWIQKDKGGRALLKSDGGKWTIHVCAGDGLLDASTLETAGVGASTAKRLVQKVVAAEKRLPADQVKKFSLFDGLVRIEAGKNHGHHGSEHKHHK